MLVALIAVLLLLRSALYLLKSWQRKGGCNDQIIGFFHPFCGNGGGGERVLWIGVAALLRNSSSNVRVVIYSGDDGYQPSEILAHVKAKFGIVISADEAARLHIVTVRLRTLLDAEHYPVATMIFQSIGGMIVTLECLLQFCPDIFCDTMGAAFGYPIAKLFGCKVATYTHYPHISRDMLQKVREQRPSYNNNALISSSVTVSWLKLIYYQAFAMAYGLVGRCADSVMVNSSWTRDHIEELWGFSGSSRTLSLIFPPCNTSSLQSLPLSRPLRHASRGGQPSEPWEALLHGKILAISVGQFRPEKDHWLQVRVMEKLLQDEHYRDVVLVMIGGVRNEDDRMLVQKLTEYIQSRGLERNVIIAENISHSQLKNLLSVAVMGLHTMWNEHFGISIVEMMAAGVITIAHRSGGPASDIIQTQTGYLATTIDEYAQCIRTVVDQTEADRMTMREKARDSVQRFSDSHFEESFSAQILALSR